ncbi:hypothetical protein ABC733_09235 [Mangrovibacter sp. SLW1]
MAIDGSPAQYTNGQMGMEVAGIDQKAAGSNGENYASLYQNKFHEKPRSVYGSYAGTASCWLRQQSIKRTVLNLLQ